MKKYVSLILIVILLAQYTFSQGVTQSAEGSSTVLFSGSAIAIDIAKADLSFGWNNLNEKIVKRNNDWLIGTAVKVKASEGIGALFSKGNLVSEGNWNFYIGGYHSNALKRLSSELTKINTARKDTCATMIKKLKAAFNVLVSRLSEKHIPGDDNNKKRDLAIKDVQDFYMSLESQGKEILFPEELQLKDEADPVMDDKIKAFRNELSEKMTELRNSIGKSCKEMSNTEFQYKTEVEKLMKNKNGYFKFTYFLFGGINALDFKRVEKIDQTNLENSFIDESFRGGNFGIGINFEYWRFRFGLTYAYTQTHNFSTLRATDYNLTTTTTANNQTLETKDAITAYGGKYGRVERNDLNIDIIYNCKLDEEGKNHILINPYLRAGIFSRDTSLLINRTNIGIGAYFFQDDAKFLGGLYIELPDINNNAEKKKPVDKQNLRPPLRRLSFGITTRFSLKSIFSW